MALPWFKFYPNDWLSDRNLRRCSHAAQGVWIGILCLMNDSKERGYLIEDDSPWSDGDIAAAVGGDKASALACILELCAKNVASRDSRGALYSRRMAKDTHLSAIRSDAGAKGAFAKANSRQTSSKPPSKHPSKPLISDLWLLISDLLPKEFGESAEFKGAWAEWEKYRRSKGKPISEIAAKRQAKKMVKEFGNVEHAIAAIEFSISNDYQGLFAPTQQRAGQPNASSPARVRAPAGKYDGI